ncbi:MAG: hypothetical protein EON93_09880 [Burkholderiales bacterium]|nr:MAG: hypothetical protein EON93_09880 [Burkholderiales bacterium]
MAKRRKSALALDPSALQINDIAACIGGCLSRQIVILAFLVAAAGDAQAQSRWEIIEDAVSRGGGSCPLIPEQMPDYVPAAIRAREEGRAVIGLCVSKEGVPETFEMLSSSGIPRIDTMTARWACGKRYQPQVDENGRSSPTCAAVAEFDWKLKDFPWIAEMLSRQSAIIIYEYTPTLPER